MIANTTHFFSVTTVGAGNNSYLSYINNFLFSVYYSRINDISDVNDTSLICHHIYHRSLTLLLGLLRNINGHTVVGQSWQPLTKYSPPLITRLRYLNTSVLSMTRLTASRCKYCAFVRHVVHVHRGVCKWQFRTWIGCANSVRDFNDATTADA